MARRGSGEASGSNGRGGAAFRVQNQIRRNAQDMQEYLADLGSWERSIKKKDKQISRRAAGGASSLCSRDTAASSTPENTPPIRQSEGPVPVSSGPAPQQSETASKERNRRKQASHSPAGSSSSTTIDGQIDCGGLETNEVRTADAKANREGPRGTTAPGASAAAHTHDKGYGKWTKFDIDAALRSADESGTAHDKRYAGSNSSSDSETGDDDSQETAAIGLPLTPATMIDSVSGQSQRRAPAAERRPPPPPPLPSGSLPTSQTQALPGTKAASRDLEKEERDRGNKKFGRGEFEEAIKSYTRCVGMNRRSSLAFSNRAMAYLKLKEFGKAEADTDAALRIDPRHVKSLQRRATARNALGKHRAALADLQTAAEIDPASKEIRKDLSKTLETLKTVVRRAPKRRVKVEGMPLPAFKPHGFSPSRKNEDSSLLAPQSDSGPAIAHAGGGAATATRADAPATADEATIAPFSSVLRGEKGGTHGGGSGSRGARTTFEELPEEAAAPTTLPPPPEPAAVETLAQCDFLPAKQIDAVRLQGRALGGMPASTGVDAGEGVALPSPAVDVEPVLSAETAGSSAGLVTVGVGALTSIAVVEGASPDSKRVAAVTPPPTAIALDAVRPDTPKEKAVVSTADRSEGSTIAGNCPEQASKALRAGACGGSSVAHAVGQEETAPSTEGKPKAKKASAKKKPAPSLKRSPAPSSATSPGAPAQTRQLPTTGYQFEHMWRSTQGSLEARLELVRAIPPSSVPKIFRRTPLEVDLLGGILQHLGAALLPRRPTTALRWLKSLPKASRFGMTVALLGEEDGRAAARELLMRLEATPSVKAYKGLYEDQLQTQHASAESYRSLTRGYSRLSADNKALRQQTTAATAGVASTPTFSPSPDGIGPFARSATSRAAPRHGGEFEAASDKHLEIGPNARNETSRAPRHGGELEASPSRAPRHDGDTVEAPKNVNLARSTTADAVPPTDAVPLSDMIGDGDVRGLALAATVPAEAVTTAAAAGALPKAAESTKGATQPSHERPASAQLSKGISPPPSEKRLMSSTECELSEGMPPPPPEKRRMSSTECEQSEGIPPPPPEKRRINSTECASTVETFACSPFSEAENAVGGQGVGNTGSAASRECSVAPPSSGSAFEIQERAADGDAGGDSRGCPGLLDAYAFPTGGGGPSARRRHNIRDDINSGIFSTRTDARSRGGGDGSSGDFSTISRYGDGVPGDFSTRSRGDDGNSRDSSKRNDIRSRESAGISGDFSTRTRGGDGKFGEFPTRKVGLVAAAVAVPPVEPPLSWRGRSSAGPERLLTSCSWSEAVDGPKRSSSPPPPRRGRWGEGGGGGGSGWGGGTAVSGQDGCTRIEPSRARPHSI